MEETDVKRASASQGNRRRSNGAKDVWLAICSPKWRCLWLRRASWRPALWTAGHSISTTTVQASPSFYWKRNEKVCLRCRGAMSAFAFAEGIQSHFDDAGRFQRPITSLRLMSDSRLSFGTQLYG